VPLGSPDKSVGEFDKHPSRRKQGAVILLRITDCSLMDGVIWIEQGEEVKRIGEYAAHRFAAP
jgi:hypothetical protein